MKGLILRADDAGSCISANEAIEEAVNAGVARNVSIMVCAPAFDDAARRFAGRTDVCLGLHVTLNAEWAGPKWGPVAGSAAVPSLVNPDGFFTAFPQDLHQRGFSVAEAVAEAEAQLLKARAAGLTLTYLDEHMVVGWLPGLRAGLGELARRHGLLDAMTLNIPHLSFDFKPAENESEESGAKGLADSWLQALVTTENPISLVVTHPGKIAPDMEAFFLDGGTPGVIAQERNRERLALTLPEFRQSYREREIIFLRYDEV